MFKHLVSAHLNEWYPYNCIFEKDNHLQNYIFTKDNHSPDGKTTNIHQPHKNIVLCLQRPHIFFNLNSPQQYSSANGSSWLRPGGNFHIRIWACFGYCIVTNRRVGDLVIFNTSWRKGQYIKTPWIIKYFPSGQVLLTYSLGAAYKTRRTYDTNLVYVQPKQCTIFIKLPVPSGSVHVHCYAMVHRIWTTSWENLFCHMRTIKAQISLRMRLCFSLLR